MRVLLADAQDKVRSALRLVIDQEPDFKVVGEVTDPDQLLDSIDKYQPDILLLDWELLRSEKQATLKSLAMKDPQLYVIAMSACIMSQKEAIAAGAQAFVRKVDPADTFIISLRNLAEQKKFEIQSAREDLRADVL
jgi:two-component system response regulator DesR